MIKKDFHVHTTLSDGKSTPEEVVLSAIEKGITTLGISDHSNTPFDDDYCLKAGSEEEYRRTIGELKEKYKDKIEILCGMEQDIYSPVAAEGYDYVIGSVHFVKAGEEYLPVDKSAALLRDAVNKYFGGDAVAFAQAYFATVARVVEVTGADIIGHFDLCTKYNEKDPLIDECDPRYVAAWKSAVDALIPFGKYFEINTGVISRGHKTKPYPARPILDYIKEKGGKLILSSDSHHKDTLCYEFDKFESLIK